MENKPAIPAPSPLKLGGSDIAADWERFKNEWNNYEIAIDLAEAPARKRAAVFLACVGTTAYGVFRTFQFDSDDDKHDVDKITEAFEKHCVGEANITYERYLFHQRVQKHGESFDDFLADLRKLVRTCDFADMKDSLIRDRIVIGIRDEPTRRRLLQVKKLALGDAIDMCRASEATARRLRVMGGTGSSDVEALSPSSSSPSRGRRRSKSQRRKPHTTYRDPSAGRRPNCRYCDRQHGGQKESCPAYGQRCRRCSKMNHFEKCCRSTPSSAGQSKQHAGSSKVCQLEADELLSLHNADNKRAYCHLFVNDKRSVNFLVDCGSSVNLLPLSDAKAISANLSQLRPAATRLNMYDGTELKTRGMLTATVTHPITGKRSSMDFYVAETHNKAILGMEGCQEMELINVNFHNICAVDGNKQLPQSPASHSAPQRLQHDARNNQQQQQSLAPSSEYPLSKATITDCYDDVFSGVGLFEGEVHLETDPGVPPVQMPPRKIPEPIKQQVKEELDDLCRAGIIEPVTEHTPWVSSLLVVTKSNGKPRICIDPRPLNKALKRSDFYMPTITDVLPKLAKAKTFSTVDCRHGFWGVKLDQESSLLTTFETPFQRYRWLRLPMGISPAPQIFQAKLQQALEGLKGVESIADDILVFGCGDTQEEADFDHDRNMIALLERCRERNIRLNGEKLQLRRPSTTYMGHELTSQGLRPDRRKIEAILDMPEPNDRPAVMRLLGMATYLSKFVPRFSEVTAPLRALLAKDTEFLWTDSHRKALGDLKQLLVSAPTLGYYDVKGELRVQTDASQNGLGCVLICNGRPVEFASRAMTPTERDTYCQLEKEMLAICFAINRFHTYLYGTPFLVESDHKPLVSIHKKALAAAPRRLQRMLLTLQRYTYSVQYVPGTQLVLADTLSRAYLPRSSETDFSEQVAAIADAEQRNGLQMIASQATIEYIRCAAQADEQYQQLIRQIKLGWPDTPANVPTNLREYSTFCDELTECDGLVFKGNRVVIPQAARAEILNRVHSSHIGVNGCLRRAQEAVYYPGISADIKRTVAACQICESFQQAMQKEPLRSHAAPSRAWEKIGVDIFTHKGQDYLITVDYLSNYFEVDRLPSKRIQDIIYVLKTHMARYGIPQTLFSDNQPFNSVEFKEFAGRWEFSHVTSSPRYPQSNGLAESAVKQAKKLMQKAHEDHTDPFLALLALRNTPLERVKLSPAQIMFNRRTRTLLPVTNKLLISANDQQAHKALVASKQRQAVYYNRGAHERRPFKAGDTVRTRWSSANNWEKAKVIKPLPHRSYLLRMPDGSTRRRTSRHVRFSREAPIVYDDDTDDDFDPPPTPPLIPPLIAAAVPAAPAAAAGNDRHPPHPHPPPPVTLTTSSGRTVKPPARFADFVP